MAALTGCINMSTTAADSMSAISSKSKGVGEGVKSEKADKVKCGHEDEDKDTDKKDNDSSEVGKKDNDSTEVEKPDGDSSSTSEGAAALHKDGAGEETKVAGCDDKEESDDNDSAEVAKGSDDEHETEK
jgi:hypothetical protein